MDLNPEQRSVVEAEPNAWLLVVAGPGTGKTQVAAMRLVHLLRSGLNPAQVLVLSFSRSAVATLTRRIAQLELEDDRIIEELRHLSIRTFDSWAFRILRLCGGLPTELLGRSYDSNIAAVADRLADKDDCSLISLLHGIRHVIVDEFQDLPGVRARMVIELLSRLAANAGPGVGFTVLGDPAQAIYRFAARGPEGSPLPDPWADLQNRIGPKLREVVLERNYRATEKLGALASSMRKILRADMLDPSRKLTAMKGLLDRLPVSPVSDKLDAAWADTLPNGSVAILTRTNGEALRVACMLLGRADGPAHIDLRLKLAGAHFCAPAWVAALLSAFRPPSLSLTAFPAVYAHAERQLDGPSREALAFPAREQAWQRLTRASGAPDTATVLDLHELRQRLNWPDSFPDDEGAGRAQILVTTIHQAKGMEFDNVELLESTSRGTQADPDPLEEANVGFVAISRAGRQIRRIAAGAIFKPPYEKSFRFGRARQVSWGKMVNFQVGLRGDIDPVSFVDEEIHGSVEQITFVQQLLTKSPTTLRGYKVALRKVAGVADSKRARDARYEIALHGGEHDGLVLGRTELQVSEDLLDLLWAKGYGMPQQIWNLRVGDVVTLTPARDEQRAIPQPWCSSLLWLGVTLIGTGDFIPPRRTTSGN